MNNCSKIIVALALTLLSFISKAQNKFSVSGTIKDKRTGEVLIGATVKVADKPTLGVATNEYGFYSNVNPEVNHPRWSQASERRIGEDGFFTKKRKTLLFNGYSEVASLYSGMDLKRYY